MHKYLLHVVVKLHLLLPQAGDELLGGDSSDLSFLSDDTVKEVGQTREQGFLVALVLGFVLQYLDRIGR